MSLHLCVHPSVCRHRRGFNDPTLWAAMTTHERVQGVTSCTAEIVNGAGGDCTEDVVKSQKWTWAVPIEIIYTTPLANWNPYNLTYCPYGASDSRCDTNRGPAGARCGARFSAEIYTRGCRWFPTPARLKRTGV
jgi:hypothetical protein